jgi:hypothetical protein
MIGLLFSPVLLWFSSEIHYASSIRPHGVQTVVDHYRRFGEPHRILQLKRAGTNYYELRGRATGLAVLATPSSPPAYVYDEAGRFVDWCPDPGDRTAYRTRWPLTGAQPVEPAGFRQKYGL